MHIRELVERQRYGRNKDTTINHAYINSGEYRKKFDGISECPELNRLIYKIAKEMLNHRSGSEYSYMYSLNEEVNTNYYKLKVEEYIKSGYNEGEAQKKALDITMQNYDIKCKEVQHEIL